MKEYVTIKTDDLSSLGERFSVLRKLDCNIIGCEVYCADIVPREEPLYNNTEELGKLIEIIKASPVKRLHASYWASPSSFLFGLNKEELYEHFGSEDAVKGYYTELTDIHLYTRWTQEYMLAKLSGAESYVFHLIDYFPVDGVWKFTISPSEVVECMVKMTKKFVDELYDYGFIDEESPVIELENAGWGLEYGIQTWKDYEYLFSQINDPLGKVRISWDINHLLHALGQKDGKGMFFLPDDEINEDMRVLQKKYSDEASLFAEMWIRYNVLNEKTAGKVATIQLSDCVMKQEEIFTCGYMNPPYRDTLDSLSTWEEKESYGEKIVLTHYDSHVPLGKGILNGKSIKDMISEIEEKYGEINVLHELKNSDDLAYDLKTQQNQLYGE
ncbi:MAG: hypothetical protein IKM61_06550 [Eubacteriaceae bacterium]|nr:hypothetical protein [Eubacteriaceae bacterium]